MRMQNEGMYTSEQGSETYSNYMESRPRHIHGVLDKYLNR